MIVDLWSLPGPRRLLAELRDALETGHSVLVLHPASVRLDGLTARLEELHRQRLWHHVDLQELAQRKGTPAQRLLDHLGRAQLAAGADVHVLAEAMRGRVLCLAPPRAGSAFSAQIPRFVEDFCAAASRDEEHERALLVCVCPPERMDPAPPSDTALLRRCWWAQTGPLDTLVVVDEVMDGARVVGDREVVAELAGWDLELAEQLALRWSGDAHGDLASSLVARREWGGPELIEHAQLASATGVTSDPPEELFGAWAAGCVDWWGGRALTHIGCHLTHGDPTAVDGRLWRGQVAAVLPFIELVRERIARWVGQRPHLLNGQWRYKDVTALEVGQLDRVFFDSPALRRSFEHYELARLLANTRHALAHLRQVDRETLRRIEALLHGELFT